MQKVLREGEQKWEHGSNSDGEAQKKEVCKGREVKVKKDEARRSGAAATGNDVSRSGTPSGSTEARSHSQNSPEHERNKQKCGGHQTEREEAELLKLCPCKREL